MAPSYSKVGDKGGSASDCGITCDCGASPLRKDDVMTSTSGGSISMKWEEILVLESSDG